MKEKDGTNRQETPPKTLVLVFGIAHYSNPPRLDRVFALNGNKAKLGVAILTVFSMVRAKDIGKEVVQS